MKFFDQKEEVIDLQLTQYGKKLLSTGQMRPVYYAFFDDDVLYDLNFANNSGSYIEIQSKTEERITKETPRTKTQSAFNGYPDRKSKLSGENNDIAHYSFGMPIGNCSLGSEYIPAWHVDFLYNKIDKTVDHYSGTYVANSPIPQINTTIEFESYVTKFGPEGTLLKDYIPVELSDVHAILMGESPGLDGTGDTEDEEPAMLTAEDGTAIQIKPDYLLLEVAEKNVDFLKENFEIEVFEIIDTGQKNSLGNSIVIEKPLEFFNPERETNVMPYHVEYWMELEVDEDVLPEYFCASSIVADRRENRLADSILPYPKDCPEYSKSKNLYLRDTLDVEEPC